MYINPQSIEVIKRDKDYVIYLNSKPLLTPRGKELKSNDSRLLEHIVRELLIEKIIDSSLITSYALLSYQIDNLDNKMDSESAFIEEEIKRDPLILRIIDKKTDEKNVNLSMIEFIAELNTTLPFIYSGVSEVVKCLNEYLMQEGLGSLIVMKRSFNDFVQFVIDKYINLAPEKKSAIRMMNHIHRSGILLPLLLVLNRVTPSEYTNTMYVIHLPNFETKKQDQENIDKQAETEHCFSFDWKNPVLNFITLHSEILKIFEYLSYFKNEKSENQDLINLIKSGESFNLEFKSTLRWNIKAGKKDPVIEHASLKTISAFLNSGGGTLLIGVEDSGLTLGLDLDAFPNEDRFSLHFWDLVKSSMGEELGSFILTSFEKINDKNIFIVKCLKSPRPVFLNQKGFSEEFYIRTGPSSTSLSIQDALKYIEFRFK